MQIELVAELPEFDTGQYQEAEFVVAGGDARLTIKLAELPSFEIVFRRVRWHQFTALPNCSAEIIRGAYFQLVELVESESLSSFVEGDRSSGQAFKELHHYRIFLDEAGSYELFAESVTAGTAIEALSLDDTLRWSQLQHAYGPADDIPGLLRQLWAQPPGIEFGEPWFSLWSALAHQGDVYSASFAAVPHVVRMLFAAPATASSAFFAFPAWIEICRQKNSVEIPEDLRHQYFAALRHLPSLVANAAVREWNEDTMRTMLSAIGAAKGYGTVAEAAQELSPEVAMEFMQWFWAR